VAVDGNEKINQINSFLVAKVLVLSEEVNLARIPKNDNSMVVHLSFLRDRG
jgi:hypothetical protein